MCCYDADVTLDELARARYEGYCERNGIPVLKWATLDSAFRAQWEPAEPVRKPVGRATCDEDTLQKRA